MSADFKKILVGFDKDFRIYNFNAEAKRAFPKMELGKHCYEAIYGLDSPCLTCPILTEDQENKIVYTDRNGKKFYATFANITFPNGSEGYVMCPNGDRVEVEDYEAQLSIMQRKMFVYRQANYDCAYLYFECNLSKDLITTDTYEVVDLVEKKINLEGMGLKKPYTYSGYHKMRLENKVLSNRDEYREMADCRKLMEKFRSGVDTLDLIFKSRSTNGYLTWHHQSIYMYKGEFDDDIYALYVVRDINHKLEVENQAKKNEEIMRILSNEYLAVFYVELETGLVSLCHIPTALDSDFRKMMSTATYPELWRYYVKNRVLNSDAEFLLRFTDPEAIKRTLKDKKSFSYLYRVGDETDYRYYEMKIVKSEEDEVRSFVLGIADKDDLIRTQQEQQRKLTDALIMAQKDSLTGVSNRTAYDIAESQMNEDLGNGKNEQFAIVMFDVNGLKRTNDIYGHEKGNLLLINSAKLICDTYKHSKVCRIGGDEFICILKGEDYENRDKLFLKIRKRIKDNEAKGDPIYENVSLASGMAAFDAAKDKNVNDVFERADRLMYDNKSKMKAHQQKKTRY